mmetsp:Transcript_29445/g.66677  ORF Transcript_29445/g.66677 Transcript_29445/m.66677 type:complete len:202 (+) Transcript_29445:17-622(+)
MDLDSILSYPPITKAFIFISLLFNAASFAKIYSGLDLLLNFELILNYHQYWRIFTHLFYFGQIGLKAFFYLFFFSRYSKALESLSFQNNAFEYLYLLILGNSFLMFLKLFVKEATFLGPGLTFMVVYLWGKKNSQQQINLINLIHIKGSSLPMILMASSWLLKQRTLKLDLMGVIAGHFYYYFSEVYPRFNGGQKILSIRF